MTTTKGNTEERRMSGFGEFGNAAPLQGISRTSPGQSYPQHYPQPLGHANDLLGAPLTIREVARLIGWAGSVLDEHPDQRAELVADPSLIPHAVEELLRYEAPSPVQARKTTADVTLHGETMPSGSRVVLLTGVVDLQDVWVVEGGDGLGLGSEALQKGRIPSQGRV